MDKKYVISGISKIRNAANNFLEEELKKCHLKGFAASHGAILSMLFNNNGKLTMGQIARYVGKDKSTVTQLIEKLIKSDYVIKEKSNEDKRITYIILTDKAWQIKDSFNKISEELIKRAYENFTEDEKETLNVLLEKLLYNFEKNK